MSEISEPRHLNNHHRDTMVKIFQHPATHNLEWHDVLSLLEAVGTLESRHDDRFRLLIEGHSHTFERPKGKDVDVETIVELRGVLRTAGYVPAAD